MTNDDREHIDGYLDGRDPDSPEPSNNRSWCYRHSFHIGRREIEKRPPIAAGHVRRMAEIARIKDGGSHE